MVVLATALVTRGYRKNRIHQFPGLAQNHKPHGSCRIRRTRHDLPHGRHLCRARHIRSEPPSGWLHAIA